jgi:hypothetical protein
VIALHCNQAAKQELDLWSGDVLPAAPQEFSAADVVARAQAVLSEAELLRAMFDVSYFPPSTPPPIE